MTNTSIKSDSKIYQYQWLWQKSSYTIEIEKMGKGKPMLLLPAFSTVSSRQEMKGIAELLADKYEVNCLDWLGFGDSQRPSLNYQPSIYQALLTDFVKDNFSEAVILVAAGHSAGYALKLAKNYPDLVAKIILIAPTWKGPLNRQAIESADLVLYGGYNFDSSLIKLIKATNNDNPKIAVHEQAVTAPILGEEHHHGHDHSDDEHSEKEHEDHDHSEEKVPDPHVWHNPQNGSKMVAVIAEGLTQIQPDLGEKYNAQTQTIQAELEQIDEWIQQQIATIPPDQRKLVTTHDALGYYVQAYNLEFKGALLGVSTDESPSAGMVADLVKEIKESQVPTIFAEISVNPQLIETVAREANVQLSSRELYADNLGGKGTEGDSYQKMLVANTVTIVEGLGGQYTAFNPSNE